MRPNRQHALASVVNLRKSRDSLLAQLPRKLVSLLCLSNRNNLRFVPLDLSEQLFEIPSRGKPNHTKSLRQSLHYRKALPPNRTRRTQYRQLFQGILCGVRELAPAFPSTAIAAVKPYDRGA